MRRPVPGCLVLPSFQLRILQRALPCTYPLRLLFTCSSLQQRVNALFRENGECSAKLKGMTGAVDTVPTGTNTAFFHSIARFDTCDAGKQMECEQDIYDVQLVGNEGAIVSSRLSARFSRLPVCLSLFCPCSRLSFSCLPNLLKPNCVFVRSPQASGPRCTPSRFASLHRCQCELLYQRADANPG